MNVEAFYVTLLTLATSCLAQTTLDATKIYDSRTDSYVSKGKKIDPAFFNGKRFWLQYESYSVLGNDEYGIKYLYDFENGEFVKINGMFDGQNGMSLSYDYTGGIGHNFYFDDGLICWLAKSPDRHTLILRSVDIQKDEKQEIIFNVPEQFLGTRPIIIDADKILYQTFILHRNGKVDTLRVEKGATFPFDGDKIFMRKNGFMIDRYFAQQNPDYVATGTNPVDYNYVIDGKYRTQRIILKNQDLGNYKVETNFGALWLLSNKIYPHKFLLYEIQSDKSFPFELNSSIFNKGNLSEIDPVVSTETAPGQDVKFSYLTSMTESDIYIYVIKNGVKLYRISEYRKLLN